MAGSLQPTGELSPGEEPQQDPTPSPISSASTASPSEKVFWFAAGVAGDDAAEAQGPGSRCDSFRWLKILAPKLYTAAESIRSLSRQPAALISVDQKEGALKPARRPLSAR